MIKAEGRCFSCKNNKINCCIKCKNYRKDDNTSYCIIKEKNKCPNFIDNRKITEYILKKRE